MATKHPDFLAGPILTTEVVRWPLVDAVAEVVQLADEPLTPPMVHGRLVLAGRRDTEAQVRRALYRAQSRRNIHRIAPTTWAATP